MQSDHLPHIPGQVELMGAKFYYNLSEAIGSGTKHAKPTHLLFFQIHIELWKDSKKSIGVLNEIGSIQQPKQFV